MRTLESALIVFTLAATLVNAAGAQSLQPLVVDWPQYFRVESEPSVQGGRSVVRGTIWNIALWRATKIRLLVDAVDADGRVTSQRVVWLGADLTAGTHASFEVPMPASPAYRVSVFAFESGRGGLRS